MVSLMHSISILTLTMCIDNVKLNFAMCLVMHISAVVLESSFHIWHKRCDQIRFLSSQHARVFILTDVDDCVCLFVFLDVFSL